VLRKVLFRESRGYSFEENNRVLCSDSIQKGSPSQPGSQKTKISEFRAHEIGVATLRNLIIGRVTQCRRWATALKQQYLRTVADARFDIPGCNLIQQVAG
jgi:hypothetical protein